jgi:hypothetical protein
VFAQSSKVLKYDSVVVKQLKPSLSQEQEVFEDVDLGFAKVTQNTDPNLWSRFTDWLLELLFGSTSSESRRYLQWSFMALLVLVGIVLAIWLFRRSDFGSYLKGNTKHFEFNFADVEEDISGIDFDKKVVKAKGDTDYRMAVRWLYLKQLHLLNQKGRIAWQPYKTNMDYANELSGSSYKHSFKDISRIYEYVWYGKYSVNEQSFHSLEKEFKQFEAAVNA